MVTFARAIRRIVRIVAIDITLLHLNRRRRLASRVICDATDPIDFVHNSGAYLLEEGNFKVVGFGSHLNEIVSRFSLLCKNGIFV